MITIFTIVHICTRLFYENAYSGDGIIKLDKNLITAKNPR